ncbi:MAG: hypothetical protein ACOCWG_01300, partial [bacterium]
MKKIENIYLLVLSIVFLLLFFFLNMLNEEGMESREKIAGFQRQLHTKENKLNEIINHLPGSLLFEDNIQQLNDYVARTLDKHEEFSIFIFQDNEPFYWSNHTIPVTGPVKPGAIKLGNTWYSVISRAKGDFQIDGYVKIKNSYPYENRFLKNNYQKDFSLPKEMEIIPGQEGDNFPVYNFQGDFLFTILPGENNNYQGFPGRLALIALSLIFLFVFLSSFTKNSSLENKNKRILLAIMVLLMMRILINYFQVNGLFRDYTLFSPKLYAVSIYLSSLGDVLLDTIFIVFAIYLVVRHFNWPTPGKNWILLLKQLLSVLFLVLFFIYQVFLFRSLLISSSINFEPHKVLELDFYSFTGLFIVALNAIAFLLLAEKTVELFLGRGILKFLLVLVSISLPVLILSFIWLDIQVITIMFYFSVVLIVFFLYKRKKNIYQLSSVVIIVIIFSLFTAWYISNKTNVKERNDRKVLAIGLATEHDPVAEMLLKVLEKKLKNDSILSEMILNPSFPYEEINSYLQKKYFTGYWEKYDFQTIICNPADSIYISPPDDKWVHCYNFFDNLMINEGVKLAESDFYFIDNLNGRISYLGTVNFLEDPDYLPITLFIELDSKFYTKRLGYPELLLDERLINEGILDEYSYAKYKEGWLVS